MSHRTTHRSPDTRPASLVALAEAVEAQAGLDGLVDALRGPAAVTTAGPTRRRVLLGHWLGHALHPLLTDLPIGLWTSAWVLDVVPVPGACRAAQRLVGLGVLCAAPTALTGWAEWSRTTEQRVRRVGVVHALANGAAAAVFAGSWLARHRGRHTTGVVLGQVAMVATSAGGFLGAHLALGRKVGTDAADVGSP